MKLIKIRNTSNTIVSDDLSINAIELLKLLFDKTDKELENFNFNLYSFKNISRKDIALSFKELRKKKYIIYSSLNDFYQIYQEPHK